jgi:hypothetical protein
MLYTSSPEATQKVAIIDCAFYRTLWKLRGFLGR